MATNASNDDFQDKTSAFVSWLKQRRGTKINPKISIVDLRERNAGRGIGTADFPAVGYGFH